MFPRIVRVVGGVCAALAAALASPARAQLVERGVPALDASAFHAPSAGATLTAGSTIDVRWATSAAELERDEADEAELVLSLDGGDTFQVRISSELSPHATSYRWRVPSLPTRSARLALRVGDGHDGTHERILLLGPEFAIASESPEPEILPRGSAEWWTEQAISESNLGDLLEASLRTDEQRIVAPTAAPDVDRPGPSVTLAPSRCTASPVRCASPASASSRVAPRPASSPRPLRL